MDMKQTEYLGVMLVIQSGFAVVGFIGNSYIITMNVKDLVKLGRLSPREELVLSVSIINLCLQLVIISNDFTSYFLQDIYFLEYVAKSFFVAGMALSCASLWVSTWLSVYCSLKIITSQQAFIKWMQQHMPKTVPWLVVASVLLSFAYNAPGFKYYQYMRTTMPVSDETNRTITHINFVSQCSCSIWLHIINISAAFILFFASTLNILSSLWRHVKNIKRNADILGNPRFDKLFRAAKTVVSLLVLCILFYITQCILLTNVVQFGTTSFVMCLILISMFPALKATILIIGNQKLKRPVIDFFKRPLQNKAPEMEQS